MKLVYRCEVDCANCANRIEEEIKKLDEVKDCSVGFMTLKCKMDVDETVDLEKFLPKVQEIFKKVDSDSELIIDQKGVKNKL